MNDRRRRVLIPQALGADEFLRVTWHEDRQVFVFSHWAGSACVAATPVRVSDLADLAALTVSAVTDLVQRCRAPWDPPSPGDLVATDPPLRRPA